MSNPTDKVQYPEQLHAGNVGLGPNFHPGPTFEEKLSGLKEEIKGKLTHHPLQVQHGKDMISGEEKRKAREEDNKSNLCAPPQKSKPDTHPKSPSESHHDGKDAKQQADTTAPQGTDDAEMKGTGQAVDHAKHDI